MNDTTTTTTETEVDASRTSLIPLANGRTVLYADLKFDNRGVGTGYVLAVDYYKDGSEAEYVTWRVWLHKGETEWQAEAGDYCSTLGRAITSYNERRGIHPPQEA